MSGPDKERLQRIKPYLSNIKKRVDPKVPDKDTIMVLMQDLKDEGNDNFRRNDFKTAHEFYYHAIFVIRVLERTFYSFIDNVFLGTIYCNAALCSLRLRKYKAALDDAEEALKCQHDSVKAIYRKALALKGLERYPQALYIAERGKHLDPKIFDDVVNELRELVATTHHTGKAEGDSDPALDWLEGTNALLSDKKLDKRGKKMPGGKKKKSKAQGSAASKQKAGQKPQVAEKESDSDKDSDSSISDGEFAASMRNVQSASKPSAYVKGKSQNEANVQKTSSQRDINRFTGQNSVGLDNFTPVIAKSRATVNQQQKKSNIAWPLEKYVYRLVCRICFTKESEGIRGYKFRPDYPHSCFHNVLIVRDKSNTSVDWLKIRPLPNTQDRHFLEYKLCINFRLGNPCRLSEANCTFAHNHVEMNLWTMNREGAFNIANFIQNAAKEGMYSSELLEKSTTSQNASANQYIPGLQSSSGGSASSTYIHPQPQLQQRKAVNSNGIGDAPIKSSASSVSYKSVDISPPNLSGNKDHTARSGMSFAASAAHANIITDNTISSQLAGYKFKLCCDDCLIFADRPWEYYHRDIKHFCTQHRLAFHMQDRLGESVWIVVRERTSHRAFNGSYNLCHSVVLKDLNMCHMNHHCSFAHNALEQYLWQQEKEGNFNISEFIIKHKQQPPRGSMTADSVKELIVMYGGYFRQICRRCFFSSVVSSKGEGGTCSGHERHVWSNNQTLAHVCNGRYTIIDHPKFQHQGAYYRLCKYLGFCERWSINSCGFAHSKVEMSVWRLERDTSVTRDEIIKQSIKLFQADHAQTPPPSGTFSSASKGTTTTPPIPPTTGAAPPFSASPKREEPKPPVKMTQFCRICWGNGQRSTEDGKKDKCIKGHSHFGINSVFIAQPSGKEIRSIPANLVLGMKLVMCAFKNKCVRPHCTHPHNQEEMDTWSYMLRHNEKTLKAIVEKLQEIEKANTRKISEGESVVNIGPSVWQSQAKSVNEIVAPGDMIINERYCNYCSISFNNQRQWDDHCASEKHMENVNWDKEHQWNYRQPPWGQGSSLSLCPSHLHNKSCRYSHVTLDMYNFCKYAHSQEELDEWKERLEFRKMKRNMARQKHMFSFTETLLEEFYKSNNSVDVLSEDLPNVRVKCENEYVIYLEEKNSTFSWTFLIVSERNLERVGLLRHQDRLHFYLMGENGSRHQVAPGDMFFTTDKKTGKHFYKIQVMFTAGLFGSFSQWVAFDFGSRPVLIKKVSVEVGHRINQVKELREDLNFLHWTSQNRKIIRCTNTVVDEFDKNLLQSYKEPQESQLIVTSDSFKELNQHNYKHKMHKLLELEEMTRQRIIARYNLEDNVEVINRIEEPEAFIIAAAGDVFLRAPLPEALTEDTQAGELLLKSVRTVLMARADDKPNTVYEAQVVGESNYKYDVRQKNRLYLAVCASTAEALSLKPGSFVRLEIQFVMDRKFFCHMHYALDSLNEVTVRDVCFPDVNRFKSVCGRDVNVSSSVLNEDQMAAVSHIVKDRKSYTPPFVMYGPFGTGKTETLAQATMALMKDKKTHRILICTQTNSAADLYIIKHFDKFLKSKGGKDKLLRIYDKRRKMDTVDPVVLSYCYKKGSTFGMPTKNEVLAHQVILITVESSLQLNVLGLQNEFTHIFIDEAGQALECETLMPLTLASPTTCIVMTGDHVQISPPVYSQEARKQKFDMSMLVRLFNLYDQMSPHVDQAMKSPFNIFLSINYRTKLEILRFISTIFYNGPENLKAYGNVPSVVSITPLKFCMVQGKEVHHNVSYLNQAEAEESIAQVKQLLFEWPQEWGERNARAVAIITFYSGQVKCIRQMMKADRSPLHIELSQVYVGTIHGVQGKEFRALFISTVRTTNILTEHHIISALEKGDDIGDLGFLSNPKLINSALTRAQSLVGVVGDAIALCMIGECIQEWRTYIKHCNNMKSLHPQTYTYDFIRNRVVDLNVGPHERIIELLSKQGQEKLKQSFPPLQKTSVLREKTVESVANCMAQSARDLSLTSSLEREIEQLLNPDLEMPKSQSMPKKSSMPERQLISDIRSCMSPDHPSFRREQSNNDVLMLNHDISCEDIIFALARESQAHVMDSLGNGHTTIKSDRISVTEDKGFVLLHYGYEEMKDSGPFKIVSEDEDFVAFIIHDQNLKRKMHYENWGIEKLKSHIGEKGFLRCKLFSYNGDTLASVLPSNAREISAHADFVGKDVSLPHWFDQGHAFIGDEVLVRLYPECTENKLVGQVKGILRRAHDPVNSLFVCQVDPHQPGILNPLQENMPSIYALTIASRMYAAKKGNVCVYKFTTSKSNKCVEFSHYEKLQSRALSQCLFVVRYLTWPPGLSLPVGLVVGVLDPGTSLETGMRILELDHNVPPSLRVQANEEARQIFANDFSLEQEIEHRQDFTSFFCFSITEHEREDVQMAISIVESDGNYDVAVHVSDIAKFISKDSTLDQECELRGASLHLPNTEPIHMLPPQACLDFCSLKINKYRLAVTVMMRVDQMGNQLGPPQAFRSIVQVKQRFSLSDVQEILQDQEEAANDYYKSCVLVLYQLSQIWRIQRLGNSHFSFNMTQSEKSVQHASLMINELQHYFNSQVAALLLRVNNTNVPLLVQPPPCSDKLMKWRKENAQFALNCIPMSRDFLDSQVCQCTRVCSCIFNFMRQHRLQTSDQVFVLRDSWLALCQAIREDFIDFEYIRDVLSNMENLPESFVSSLKFGAIQEKAYFACSNHLSPQEKEHYSLCLPGYTYFSSPLERFISIVVQRLLIAYIEGTTSPYSAEEITEICSQASFKESQLAQLQSDTFCLNLGVALQNSSLVSKAVVESVNEKNVILNLASMRTLLNEKLTLRLSALNPIKINVIDNTHKQVKLYFEERIYDHAETEVNSNLEPVELDPNRFVCSIPSKDWQKLLFATRETAQDDAGEKESCYLIECIQSITQLLGGEQRLMNSSSQELMSNANKMHHASFTLLLQPSQYLQVQITSGLRDGLLKPSLQLLSLSPRYNICLEHRQDPERCFTLGQEESSSSAAQFSDISNYQTSCLHALASETACQTVTSGERITIHGVNISWSSKAEMAQKKILTIQGEFTLSREFCIRSKFQPKAEDECSNSCLAFLCVQYSNMRVNGKSSPDENVAALFNTRDVFTWVGHCIVTSIHHLKEAMTVKMLLSQSSVSIPDVLLHSDGKKKLCTIEWIERVKEHQVLDEMVRNLQGASEFAKDVILGKRPRNSIDPLEMPNDMRVISSLSKQQLCVLEECYRESVSTIHGGPGTGKSLLATLLSILFAIRNKKADAFRRINQECGTQVMVCAPTEKALDVIAEYFNTLRQHNLQLVRVYSEEIEENDFPIPGSQVTRKDVEMESENVMKKIALHHLIRQKENTESKAIQEYEILASYGDQSAQTVEMKDAVKRAQALELRKADIILCTCITSSRPILRKASNIKQVILDDSSLLSELAGMVPTVHHKNVNQLVLIGDLNMPFPPIHNKTTFKTGLSKSLFHRYCDSTNTLLTEQFRSLDSLSRFPSNHFYSGELTSGIKNRQVSCRSIPWPCDLGFYSLFCHVEGTESYTAGSSQDVNQISNQSEASFVGGFTWNPVVVMTIRQAVIQYGVRSKQYKRCKKWRPGDWMSLANAFTQYHNVPVKSLLIVTFSKAQCALLKSRMPSGIKVCTVLESLGHEFEYVIISTVRSNDQNKGSVSPSSEGSKQHLESTFNPSFVNLAVTRARSAMIIVGNKDLLSQHEPWKSLLHFYYEKHAVQANSQDYLISLMV